MQSSSPNNNHNHNNSINNNNTSNNNNNNINNENNKIINYIFKSPIEINKIIESIEYMLNQYPECKELITAKQLVTDTRERSRFDEKVDTIKRNASKDFNEFAKQVNQLQNNNNNGGTAITNNQNLEILLNKYVKFRVLIEFNNCYQRKFVKDYFGSLKDNNKGQMVLVLHELSAFHNSAPLGFNDLVYRDFTDRYIKMFSDFNFLVPTANDPLQLQASVFKIFKNNNITFEILNSLLEFKQFIKDNIKLLPPPPPLSSTLSNNHNNHSNNNYKSPTSPIISNNNSNSLIKIIFKSPEINDIVKSVDNLIKVKPELVNELTQIKDIMSSKEGQKATSLKIETIKRNAMKYIKEETILNEKKSILDSDLFIQYIQLRVMVEFSFIYQRKKLREQPDHKLQSPSIQSKRMNDLSIFHNSFPMYIYDLVKKDYSSNKYQRISREFTFTLNDRQITIPTFKLLNEDISDTIQDQFNKVYQLIQFYKKNRKASLSNNDSNNNDRNNNISTNNINNNNNNNNNNNSDHQLFQQQLQIQQQNKQSYYHTNSDDEDEDDSKYYEERINNYYNGCEDDEDDECNDFEENYEKFKKKKEKDQYNDENDYINNSVNSINNSNLLNNRINNNNLNLTIRIINEIFKSPEVSIIKQTLNELIELYPEFTTSLVLAKEIIMSNEGNKGLDAKIEIIKKNGAKGIQEELGIFDQTLFNKYMTFRLMVEFSWMHQRKLLRKYIYQHIPKDKIQSTMVSKIFNELSTFHNKTPLFFDDLINCYKFDMVEEYPCKLDLLDGSTIQGSIPLFKLSPNIEYDISTVIHSLFVEIQQNSKTIKDNNQINKNILKSKINSLNQLTVNSPIELPSTTPLKDFENVIGLLKALFNHQNFNKSNTIFSNLFSIQNQYPNYSSDIMQIKDQLSNKNCKIDFYDFLKRLQVIKQKVSNNIDNIIIPIINSNQNLNQDRVNNELLDRILLYQLLIEYTHFNQKVQLKDSLENLKPNHESSYEILNRLNSIHQTTTSELYKFNYLLSNGSFGNNKLQLDKFFFKNAVYTLMDGKQVEIKLMEFASEPITTFINYFFKQAQDFVTALVNSNGILKNVLNSTPTTTSTSISSSFSTSSSSPNSNSISSSSSLSLSPHEERINRVLKNGILKSIFKIMDQDNINLQINEMAKLFPKYSSSFKIIRETLSSNQKEFESIIERLKKPLLDSNHISKASLTINKQSIIRPLYSTFRLLIEFNNSYQRKCLKELIGDKKHIMVKLLSQLEGFHSHLSLEFDQIIKKDYSGLFKEILRPFEFNLNGKKQTPIPYFKLSTLEDSSLVIKDLLNEILNIFNNKTGVNYIASYKPSTKVNNSSSDCSINNSSIISPMVSSYASIVSSPPLISTTTTTSTINKTGKSNSTSTSSNNNSKTINSLIESNDDIIGIILKYIFDYLNFGDDEKIFSALMEMKLKYIKYRGSLLEIREKLMYDKDSSRVLKERIEIVKRNVEDQLMNHLKTNGKDSSSVNEFKSIFKSIMIFRVLVEFNNFYQRIQLKERIDMINQTKNPSAFNLANELLQNLIKLHYKDPENEIDQLLSGTLFSNSIFNTEFNYSLDNIKQLSSREFKFGGEPISTYYKSFSNQAISLLSKETNKHYLDQITQVKNNNDDQKIENTINVNNFIPPDSKQSSDSDLSSNNTSTEYQQQISPSKISATREENEKLLEEIRKLEEDIKKMQEDNDNVDQFKEAPTFQQQPDINNSNITNSSTTLTSNSTSILKNIFKSVNDLDSLLESINQMICQYPKFKGSLNLMNDILKVNSSNFNLKIDTIKKNTVREFKLLVKSSNNEFMDEKSILNDTLFNLYISFRAMVEFSYIHQKKLLETLLNGKNRNEDNSNKLVFQLCQTHNSPPILFKDLIQRQYVGQIVKDFIFNLNGEVISNDNNSILNGISTLSVFTIHTFKLLSDDLSSNNNIYNNNNNNYEDISIVTKELLNEIQSLAKSYNIIENNNINNN